MPQLDIAHVREQGQDVIITPLDSSFDRNTPNEQHATIGKLQVVAHGAGLKGVVVAVWESPSGRLKFIAPRRWHPFFQSIDMNWVARNINRSLSW